MIYANVFKSRWFNYKLKRNVFNLSQGHWWVCADSWSASSCPHRLEPRRTDPDGPPEASFLPSSPHAQRSGTAGPGVWTKRTFKECLGLNGWIKTRRENFPLMGKKLCPDGLWPILTFSEKLSGHNKILTFFLKPSQLQCIMWKCDWCLRITNAASWPPAKCRHNICSS